ncbi:conserved hypothetical protein [Sphingomonas aurantiaca]|uniref:Beta-lactamase-related domain-containing protein n=1 Tax=Sphingomonas aurantiaca TaxID=185949 RepID=A0A5E8AG57_9SPHN|nr:serine hydrolase [Sphingomonas aurantiaca]VVT30007.1 conserved hypothetical protein [Sphingomonas aurantiaca]
MLTLKALKGDTFVAIVDGGASGDPKEVVAAAWKRFDPGFARSIRLVTKAAATESWDEAWAVDYETSPDEKLVLFARAMRHGEGWTVVLARGSEATFEKRAGAIRKIGESLRPAGLKPEDFVGNTALPFDAARREQLKAFWRDAMAAYGVPGIEYAFIDRGGVVEEGGIGVKTIGKADPVDAHTRFMIASNTKGMTTLLLAKLVDRGKLGWDEPVVEADPAFRLGDASVQREIEIRHLICACTGMPRQDMEWIMTGGLDTPANKVLSLLAGMKPTTKLGEMFQYSNLLASAAGYIAGHVDYPRMDIGHVYDRAMQIEILDPLGMKDTTFSKAVAVAGNHADPRDIGMDGTVALGTIDKSDSIYFARPAGGAWSSAHDLARYALNELREGVLPSGGRLVSREALLARRNLGMEIGEAATYGMGLQTSRRWGVAMVHHGGAMPGYKTDWIVLPDAGIGIVLLTNAELGTSLLDQTRRRLVEILYGARLEASAAMKTRAAALRAEYAALIVFLELVSSNTTSR